VAEAEYADGYVHREDAQDHSPYVSGKNIFSDVLESRPVAAHGPMVRFSLVTPDATHTIDWTVLPDNARPIRFKHMERDLNGDGQWDGAARLVGVDFGYQYTDESGRNVQEVMSL
jgi:hypothetical protein